MDKIRQFMYGRYGGNDALSRFLVALYFIIFVLNLFLRRTIVGTVLSTLALLIVVFYIYRCFSRNIYRRSAENQKFLKLWNPVKNYFKFCKLRFQERNSVKKLYRCPKCHQTIRVPKGKGKIAITCPKCRFEFIKRT